MKKIGLCHGVFDVLHFGHINYFESAKKLVDTLVVSVTTDKYVNKGINRPIFNVEKRIKFLKNIKLIDQVILSDSKDAISSLKKIKPDIYFKGNEYKKNVTREFNSFNLEKVFCKKNKIKIHFTVDPKFSSSAIINAYSSEDELLKEKIQIIKKKYSLEKILEILNSAISKNITIIGDPIIDKFRYGQTVGVASKSPSIALLEAKSENYVGGAIAVAEMLAALDCKVNLISCKLVSDYKFIKKRNKNIKEYNLFSLKKYPVIERIVDEGRFIKLLQIYNLKNIFLSKKNETKIIRVIKSLKIKNNFFLITDFGFGFMTDKIIQFFNSSKVNFSLNCHLNALNLGFNYYERYKKFDLITFNQREFDINFRNNSNFSEKLSKARQIMKNMFAITLGSKGSYLCFKNKTDIFPAIFRKTIDPIGCGDAYFAMVSILKNVTSDLILINFLGNLYAGLHGQVVGNKSFVSKKNFINNIKSILS